VDLAVLWRSRRWRRLRNLIEGLPRNSAYVEAVAGDEDLAMSLPEPSGEHVERWSEFSPEREMLMVIADRVGELIRAQVAASGGKPPKLAPLPRPVTASARVRQARRWQQHQRLVAQLLPHKAG
jgi:hypothetical protein